MNICFLYRKGLLSMICDLEGLGLTVKLHLHSIHSLFLNCMFLWGVLGNRGLTTPKVLPLLLPLSPPRNNRA